MTDEVSNYKARSSREGTAPLKVAAILTKMIWFIWIRGSHLDQGNRGSSKGRMICARMGYFRMKMTAEISHYKARALPSLSLTLVIYFLLFLIVFDLNCETNELYLRNKAQLPFRRGGLLSQYHCINQIQWHWSNHGIGWWIKVCGLLVDAAVAWWRQVVMHWRIGRRFRIKHWKRVKETEVEFEHGSWIKWQHLCRAHQIGTLINLRPASAYVLLFGNNRKVELKHASWIKQLVCLAPLNILRKRHQRVSIASAKRLVPMMRSFHQSEEETPCQICCPPSFGERWSLP